MLSSGSAKACTTRCRQSSNSASPNGLSFLATYTWSHALDDAGNPGIGGGPPYRNTNLIPLKYEFTNSNYDIRHRITFNGLYDLPFGKGRNI